MSIENEKVIDFASIDLNGNVVLTISDHLQWDADNYHLLALQNKINAYLQSIEAGELHEKYPNAENRQIRIHVIAKYLPNDTGKVFLKHLENFLESAGYKFSFEVVAG